MSLVAQRVSHPYRSSRHGRPSGGAHSVINGREFDRAPLILPTFSGFDERNVKLNMADDIDNTTVITSEHSYAGGLPERYASATSTPGGGGGGGGKSRAAVGRSLSRLFALVVRVVFGALVVLSASVMAIAPFVFNYLGHTNFDLECGLQCEAALLFIVISTVTLGFAVHLTWRSAASTLPRLSCARTSFFMATLFVLVAFWLFYIFRALVRPSIDFAGVLHYAATLLFLLIILHALWLSYAHRRRRNAFRISVVRDPDGERHDVLVDAKSIQEAAVDVLNAYHAKFDVFNAYAEHVRLKTFDAKWAPQLNFKIYHVEQNSGAALNETNIGKLIEVAGRQSGRVHNEHYAQEMDRERRVDKRKYRLIAATEEAFSRLHSINEEYFQKNGVAFRAAVAVKAIMTAISKPMNRYLKATSKHQLQPPQSIMEQLEFCYRNGLSARVFLSFVFRATPPPRLDTLPSTPAKWTIASHARVSSSLRHGQQFVLRGYRDTDAGIQLVCSVHQLGPYNLMEEEPSAVKLV